MRVHLAASLLLLTSCVEENLSVFEGELTSTNGKSLNGISLNGISLNGISLNGISLNGISLNGISLNGISLNGSQLTGTSATGPVSGASWVGARMTGLLSNGSTLQLRIDGASPLAAPNEDVWAYDVKYASDGDTWYSLCGGNLAIPLSGTWNYDAGVAGGGSWTDGPDITFGCRGTALAKCVELGYKPWQTTAGKSLREYHQACTRMLRADYCGDGTPNTFTGWQLNVFDNLDIQAPASGLGSWGFEARWSASGAVCMSSYRALDLIMSTDLPGCVSARIDTACTAGDFSDGSVLQNYFDPWGINVALKSALDTYPLARADLQGAQDRIALALDYLGQTPARPRDAAQKIEEAVTKIKTAITKDLPASFGNDLMRRYTLLVRSSLVDEIAKKVAAGTPANQLTSANTALANGDALANKTPADYPAAVSRYKNGIGSL